MIVDSRSLQTLVHLKDRKEEISDIKFSPGEHSNFLEFDRLHESVKQASKFNFDRKEDKTCCFQND